MPDVVITEDNWTNIIDEVRKIDPDASVRECLINWYPVCINHIITPLSRELWNLYCSSGEFKNETYESCMELPQIVYEGFNIIRQEVNRIDKKRQDDQESEAEHQRNVSVNKRGRR